MRWLHDVFGNSTTVATFDEPAETLTITSVIVVEHYPLSDVQTSIDGSAQAFPFSYPRDEVPDLGRTNERHSEDPEHLLDEWARSLIMQARSDEGHVDTMELLVKMTRAINAQFRYETRFRIGTQTPLETLERGAGTCRDIAYFMMEAVRALGMAARFVSGYLYDPSLDQEDSWPSSLKGDAVQGAGSTHAWVQVYLPGAGWIEFDPTNGIIGGRHLIRVAVSRQPDQAMPLTGSYYGAPDAFLGMDVDVSVTAS